MGLGEEDVQRVKAGVLPLHAGAEVAPREKLTAVERVPKGPHLCNDRVQPKGEAVVQQLGRPGPERLFRGEIQLCPFEIADPDSPPLPGREGRIRRCRRGAGGFGGRSCRLCASAEEERPRRAG